MAMATPTVTRTHHPVPAATSEISWCSLSEVSIAMGRSARITSALKVVWGRRARLWQERCLSQFVSKYDSCSITGPPSAAWSTAEFSSSCSRLRPPQSRANDCEAIYSQGCPAVVRRVPVGVAGGKIGWGNVDNGTWSCVRRMSSAQVQPPPLSSLPGQDAEDKSDNEEFLDLGHKLADAAGETIRQYFRKGFEIVDKDDLSPVTIADRAAEEAMSLLIKQQFPSHAIFGEEGGLQMPECGADYLWVLDPIDGTKSFITGKPVFGTLIALLYKGVPILGIIDQPVLRERWVGRRGKGTTLNGEDITTRLCSSLSNAYLYTTSPHLFSPHTEKGFIRVRDQVKIPLYGCDCYAYGLLAAGHVDLVVESGLKPYDYLALVPVVEGAGGVMSDWTGKSLRWWPDEKELNIGARGTEVIASGCRDVHEAALKALAWE